VPGLYSFFFLGLKSPLGPNQKVKCHSRSNLKTFNFQEMTSVNFMFLIGTSVRQLIYVKKLDKRTLFVSNILRDEFKLTPATKCPKRLGLTIH